MSLKWEQIAQADCIKGIRYPVDFDIENTDFRGWDISSSDFSQVRGLRWHHIENAKKISGITYPADFDIENADFSKKSISWSDFRRLAVLLASY